nr:hypothetical protein [uncultured Dyadobacter sp.]
MSDLPGFSPMVTGQDLNLMSLAVDIGLGGSSGAQMLEAACALYI